ncbi:MAG: hypothetical protein KBD53_01960 [Candidatus Omnitrophica bacterium]|nr:hypothetical protein [Candidatus Omnitrophota bacterium]
MKKSLSQEFILNVFTERLQAILNEEKKLYYAVFYFHPNNFSFILN